MNLIDIAFLLKKTDLFGSLDFDQLLTISESIEVIHYKKGQTIFALNQEAHQLYLIANGNVAIQNSAGALLAKVTEGDFFGEEALFSERPRAYSALSKSKTTLLALSRSHLLGIIAECHSVTLALLKAYSTTIDFRKR